MGLIFSSVILMLWIVLPVWGALRIFKRKDL
jgi:hypothetical protein